MPKSKQRRSCIVCRRDIAASGFTRHCLQRADHSKLIEEAKELTRQLEYFEKYYSLDIALPEKRICIELDGGYWHSNAAKGYLPIGEAQKRNALNDKRKTSFLLNAGWTLIRVWESDFREKEEEVLERIERAVHGKS